MKFVDPSGHCSAPASGTHVICFARFIATPYAFGDAPALGLWAMGNDRDFSASGGISKLEVSVDMDTGDIVNQFIERTSYGAHTPATTFGPSPENKVSIQKYGENLQIDYDVVIAGPLHDLGAPHINGSVGFIKGANGTYNSVGKQDGFPWTEAVYYSRNSENESFTSQFIMKQPATQPQSPVNLFGAEKFVSRSIDFLWPKFGFSNLMHDFLSLISKPIFGWGSEQEWDDREGVPR